MAAPGGVAALAEAGTGLVAGPAAVTEETGDLSQLALGRGVGWGGWAGSGCWGGSIPAPPSLPAGTWGPPWGGQSWGAKGVASVQRPVRGGLGSAEKRAGLARGGGVVAALRGFWGANPILTVALLLERPPLPCGSASAPPSGHAAFPCVPQGGLGSALGLPGHLGRVGLAWLKGEGVGEQGCPHGATEGRKDRRQRMGPRKGHLLPDVLLSLLWEVQPEVDQDLQEAIWFTW